MSINIKNSIKDNIKIGIIGLGFVGGAMLKSFKIKNINVAFYDKYKNGGIGSIEDVLDTEILFLALPTQYNESINEYDKSAINDVLEELEEKKYNGLAIIRSTIEPKSTEDLAEKYNIDIVHNPEFLTARTAFENYHNQKLIVIGKTSNVNDNKVDRLVYFFEKYYSNSKIKVCSSTESELMKITENSFAATKIQFFNEIYLLSQKLGIEYDNVRDLLLSNDRINYNHTNVPGPDGQLSYGGYCFPKDSNALFQFMKKNNTPSNVLGAVINERNAMRTDNINIIKKNE